MNIKSILLFICFFASSTLASIAKAEELFYFQTYLGEEVTVVAKQKSGNNYALTFLVKENQSPENIFREYVENGLQGQLYTYDFVSCPTLECHVGFTANGDGRKKRLSLLDLGRKILESAATQAGSRGTDAVINKLTQGTTAENSKFTFLVSNVNGKPTYICKVTGAGCDEVEEVVVSSIDNGFSISYPFVPFGGSDSDRAFWQNVGDSINSWIYNNQRGELKCTSRVITRNGVETIELRCHWSY